MIEIAYEGRTYCFSVPERADPIISSIASTRTFYEIEMLEDIRRRVRPDDLVLDIGANIGNHTIFLAGVCGCEVFAFEPLQESLGFLHANVALNGLEARVKSLPIALGAVAGHGVARLRQPDNPGTAAIDLADSGGDIPISPLDEMTLPRDPALLKIDVERAELDVLKGAGSLLQRCRPVLYVEAIDEQLFESIVEYLAGFDYQVLTCFNATPTFLFATVDDPRISADERRLDRLFGRNCIRHRRELHELRVQVREKARKLRQTKEVLRRTRRWLKKVMGVARRRKGGPVYRIRRTLVTTSLLPSLVRRLISRRLRLMAAARQAESASSALKPPRSR